MSGKMSKTMLAKPIIKDKFWIVEEDGEKVATIQAGPNGVVYVKDHEREQFISLTNLTTKYNIIFDTAQKAKKVKKDEYQVHGYPAMCSPFNGMYDVTKKLPVFTKTERSKSFYCAGYYVIKFAKGWVHSYCPKLLTLTRYEYAGPFKDKMEMKEQLRLRNGE